MPTCAMSEASSRSIAQSSRLACRAELLPGRFFARPLPVGPLVLNLVVRNEDARSDIFPDGRSCSDGGPRANVDGRHQLRIRPDMDVIADNGSILVYTIVVAGNGTGAHVDP